MDEPVLLTGAGGRVGRAVLSGIGGDYDWRLLDREPVSAETLRTGVAAEDVVVADVTDESAVREAAEGVGAVVHLAGDPRPNAPWDSVLANNVDGTRTVMAAAADAGVDRFVFASSNHAVGAYETDDRTPDMYRDDDDYRLDGSELPRPSNLYGVSKAAGETLGRYYHDQSGMSVACVRIGNLTKGHPPREYERGQAMWLSHRDCAHLFDRCLRAEYGYEIVYGISDNDRKYYSLDRAREVLGYEPQDNSAEYTFEGDPKGEDAVEADGETTDGTEESIEGTEGTVEEPAEDGTADDEVAGSESADGEATDGGPIRGTRAEQAYEAGLDSV